MALLMHAAFRGRSVLRAVVLRAVGDPDGRHRDHVALDRGPRRRASSTRCCKALHLPGAHTVWLAHDGYALAVMIFADVWKTAPFMALLLLAGLQVIPEELVRRRQGRRRDRLAAVRQDHAAAAQAGDPGRADLQDARCAADLRPAVRADAGLERHDHAVAVLLSAADAEPPDRAGLGAGGARRSSS